MIRPLKMVALDLSLTATGIAVTHDQVGVPRLSCRTVTPLKRPSENVIDHVRLHETFQAISAALAFKPDLVVIEFLPKVRGTGGVPLRLAELHGAIKHFLWSQHHRYVDVEPQHVKTYAAANGNAKKELVLQRMRERYGAPANIHIGTSDEADALALLALGMHAYGQPLTDRAGRVIPVPAACVEAVGKVSWPELGGGA